MSAYVDECRREWKRLGVPDLLAEEMATELEADLAEAETEGVAATEILGESDPRHFAATWANERGLVSERRPKPKSRKGFWIGLAVGLVVLGFLLGIGGVALFAKPKLHVSGPRAAVQIPGAVLQNGFGRVPDLLGLPACHAKSIALNEGFRVRSVPTGRCDAIVVRQTPAAGTPLARHARRSIVTLRLGRL